MRRSWAHRVTTALLATECFAGGVMALARIKPFARIVRRLGYPRYFMTLHGVSYLLAGAALVAPGAPRLKEWAYAGLAFTYIGAFASHLAVRDRRRTLVAPIAFLGTTLASWATASAA